MNNEIVVGVEFTPVQEAQVEDVYGIDVTLYRYEAYNPAFGRVLVKTPVSPEELGEKKGIFVLEGMIVKGRRDFFLFGESFYRADNVDVLRINRVVLVGKVVERNGFYSVIEDFLGVRWTVQDEEGLLRIGEIVLVECFLRRNGKFFLVLKNKVFGNEVKSYGIVFGRKINGVAE